jgi:hypothetical protein
MERAAEGLAMNEPELVHAACLTHALHRICESICMLYPNADKFSGWWKENLCEATN